MDIKRKIAVFDFCGTLANYQTFDPFLKRAVHELHPKLYKLIANKFFMTVCNLLTALLGKIGFKGFIYKNILIYLTKGCTEDMFINIGRAYYCEEVRPNIIQDTYRLMESLKAEGYILVILSGGSKYYIKCFSDEFGVDEIITAEICLKNGKSVGKLKNACMNEEKVELLNRYLARHNLGEKIDICVTDSITDKPILDLAQKKVIVSHKYHQKWVEADMEEIIWE
jgi:HAD superfamily phosphoserine phosphatase-like hydrolase